MITQKKIKFIKNLKPLKKISNYNQMVKYSKTQNNKQLQLTSQLILSIFFIIK
jgi:hypothetical protein